jgi:Arc/MetJ-type ribon-helix-helix transcriptional regulator
MAGFDYRTVAQLFPARSEAELFPARHRRRRREPVGYGRFARAADAIRFAIEELPAELLPDACLEVDEKVFDRDGIRRLYDSNEYPLARRAAPVRALGPVRTCRTPMIRQSPRR